MAIHDKKDLLQMQSLPLQAKILMTERRIREWVDHWGGDVYVSFSGGKDSTVLKHIVDQMYDNIPAVFVNTGLEYPEIQQFVRDIKAGKHDCFNSDVEIIRPELRFDEVIHKYGYPVISKEVADCIYGARTSLKKGNLNSFRLQRVNGTLKRKNGYDDSMFNISKYAYLMDAPFEISANCCRVMKKNPFAKYEKETGRKPIVGVMASESRQRAAQWMKTGCNAFDLKKPQSKPMSFWTEQDVLHYIKEHNVPYCPVYGDIKVKPTSDTVEGQLALSDYLGCNADDVLYTTGCSRTGCMFCMFGCHLEKEPNRFQRMKLTHPKQYEYCMNKLGLKEVLEYINVPYE